MSILKKSLKIYKENFIKIFLLDLAFFFFSFLTLMFVKNKIQNYLALLQSYAPQLTTIQEINATNPETLALVSQLESITRNTLFFAYIIVPLLFLLIFVVTKGFIWKILISEIKNKKRFFFRFSMVTVTAIILFTLLTFPSMSNASFFNYLDISIIKIIVLSLFISYFASVIYSNLNGHSSFYSIIKSSIAKSIKKIYIILPVFLLFYVLSLALIFLLLSFFISYTTGIYFLLPKIQLLLYILLCIAITGYVRIVFFNAAKI